MAEKQDKYLTKEDFLLYTVTIVSGLFFIVWLKLPEWIAPVYCLGVIGGYALYQNVKKKRGTQCTQNTKKQA